MKAFYRGVLLVGLTTCLLATAFSQNDTIKLNRDVPMVSTLELTALTVKAGDTVAVFKAAENVYVNDNFPRAEPAIKKDAVVLAVVVAAQGVQKGKPNHKKASSWTEGSYGDVFWKDGGLLTLNLVAVQAGDGTYLPLNDCSITQYGGANGDKEGKTPATIPAGSRKTCKTKYPDAFIVVKKQ